MDPSKTSLCKANPLSQGGGNEIALGPTSQDSGEQLLLCPVFITSRLHGCELGKSSPSLGPQPQFPVKITRAIVCHSDLVENRQP